MDIFYTTNIISDVSRISLIFTEFVYFPQDGSQTHTTFYSTEPQLILRAARFFWKYAAYAVLSTLKVNLCIMV